MENRENQDEQMEQEQENEADVSITEQEFMAEAQQRHQETEDMNLVLEMVAPSGRADGRALLEFSELEQELENIEREQNDVLQRLEEASRSATTHEVPAALTNIIGTWRALPIQDPHQFPTSLQHAPAFLYKYMWFKLDGFNLHWVLFTGHNHQRRMETIGMECDGDLEGTRKMTFVEGNRLVTSHRRVQDGAEVMRVEIFVEEEDEKLYYIFQKDQSRLVKVYERAFSRS